MFKVLFVSLLIVSLVFFVSSLTSSDTILSPSASQKEKVRQTTDDLVFGENKAKVVAKTVDWAKGNGRLHDAVDTTSYLVVDKSGNVIFAKSPDSKRSPASLVKLMTAMVVLDFVSLSEVIVVPKEAIGLEPTILEAEAGESFTVQELLQAMLITSANDAAETLAHGVAKKLGGSRDVFIRLMNQKAKSLGLSETRFANPTGFDEKGQYSTARDLAKTAYWATFYYPAISEIVKTESASLPKAENHKKYELPNWNSLLGIYPGVNGVKIGFTDEAGHVTIVRAEREGQGFTVVLLGAPDRRAKDLWAAQLLNSAFEEVGVKAHRVTRDMLLAKSNEWSQQLTVAKDENAQPYNKEVNSY